MSDAELMSEALEAALSLLEARTEIVRLREALEPFGRNADAVSLSEALGHICREDLLRARNTLALAKV